jgi:hypothetical protein
MMNWKDLEGVVMAKFEVLSWHLPGGTEKNHKNFSHVKEVSDHLPGCNTIWLTMTFYNIFQNSEKTDDNISIYSYNST